MNLTGDALITRAIGLYFLLDERGKREFRKGLDKGGVEGMAIGKLGFKGGSIPGSLESRS